MQRLTLGCVLALAWGFAGVAQVEFPLNYYSFEEIAQRLSVEGCTVECARDLQGRLAVIRLNSRSWQAARELLEAGLDVRLRKISDAENRWILERDPDTARQERRWREQLAAALEKLRDRDARMLRLLMDKNASLDTIVNTFLAEDLEEGGLPEGMDKAQVEAEMRRIISIFREFPVELALRDWRAFERMQRQREQFIEKLFAEQSVSDTASAYQQFCEQHSLQGFGFSPALLQWAERMATRKDEEHLKLLRESMGLTDPVLLDNPKVQQWALLNFLGAFTREYLRVWARDALTQQMRPPLSVLEAMEQGVVGREYTVALPAEVLASLLGDADGKVVPIDSPAPIATPVLGIARWHDYGFRAEYHFPNAPEDGTRSSYYSANFWDLALVSWDRKRIRRTLGKVSAELRRAYEQALERHTQLASQPPVNQPLKAAPAAGAPLMEFVYRWAQEHHQEVAMEVLGVGRHRYGGSRGSLAQALEAHETPYLLEQRAGVWILRCWSAFVDRVGDYPLAAIRDLMRSDFSYEAWRRYYRAVRPEQARWLLGYHTYLAWNLDAKPTTKPLAVSLPDLAGAWLVMLVLESLPAETREQFWNPPADAPLPSLALAQLPLEARTRLLQTLTLWRASLIEAGHSQGRTRFLSPSEWLERLTLSRESSFWSFRFVNPDERPDQPNAASLLHTQLPGNPTPVSFEENLDANP